MNSRVYLDYNATTPVHPDVKTFVISNLDKFGNPSSVHWAGRESKRLIHEARQKIAQYLNCDLLELVFTASGSESNNTALRSTLNPNRNEIVASNIEHPSVMRTLSAMGHKVRFFKVSREGLVDLSEVASLVGPQTALVTCQLVNNETGQILPIQEISKIAHAAGAVMHSDMVQALGKIPIDLRELDVDMASFSAHKFYSLKGAAALYVRRGTRFQPLVYGGAQERARRAGTENALAISAFGKAVENLGPKAQKENARLRQLRDELQDVILKEIPGSRVNGGSGPRVANTLNISFDHTDGETLLINLDTRGYAVSSGAACSSGSQEPSPVLTAMGLSRREASESLRISLGWLTTNEEVQSFFINLRQAVHQIRESQEAEVAL